MTNSDLDCAAARLHSQSESCVLQNGDIVFSSREHGVKPLCDWVELQKDFTGFSAADRIVGKAAAMLYLLLHVKAVYADVMTTTAKTILSENGVAASCDVLTEHIINRKGDGICPMEDAVRNESDPKEAYHAIKKRMQELRA